MSKNLSVSHNILPADDAFKKSIARLQKYQKELPDNEFCFKCTEKEPFNKYYRSESFKRSAVKNISFSHAVFDDSSWTNSTFENVNFCETPFINSNASYCNFKKCTFIFKEEAEHKIQGSNFSYATLSETTFQNMLIKNSTFDNMFFDHCTFINTVITESTFEGTTFNNCVFEDVDMSNLNLDFAEFTDCQMNNVTFPFFQFPYILGGITALLNSGSFVYVSAAGTPEGRLEADEYKKLMPDIINYFAKHSEYFPVANLFAALGNETESLNSLVNGLEDSIRNKNFRMLKFYCKLACNFDYIDYGIREKLYNKIYDPKSFGKMSPQESRDYFAQLGEIRRLLLFNDTNKHSFEISLKTNIESDQSEILGIFLSGIESLFSIYPAGTVIYSIELKHRCPWDAIIKVITEYGPTAVLIMKSLIAALSTCNTFVESVENVKKFIRRMKRKMKSSGKTNLDDDLMISQIELNNAKTAYLRSQTASAAETAATAVQIDDKETSPFNPAEFAAITNNLLKAINNANENFKKYNIKAELTYHLVN